MKLTPYQALVKIAEHVSWRSDADREAVLEGLAELAWPEGEGTSDAPELVAAEQDEASAVLDSEEGVYTAVAAVRSDLTAALDEAPPSELRAAVSMFAKNMTPIELTDAIEVLQARWTELTDEPWDDDPYPPLSESATSPTEASTSTN